MRSREDEVKEEEIGPQDRLGNISIAAQSSRWILFLILNFVLMKVLEEVIPGRG
jgi:hypothetical protein